MVKTQHNAELHLRNTAPFLSHKSNLLFLFDHYSSTYTDFSGIILCNTVFTPNIVHIVLRNVFTCFSVVLFSQSEAPDGHPSSRRMPVQSRYCSDSALLKILNVNVHPAPLTHTWAGFHKERRAYIPQYLPSRK